MDEAFSPIPREARPYQGERAGLVTRLVAAIIDTVSVAVALMVGYVGINAFSFVVSPRRFELVRVSAELSLTTALVACVLYLTTAWSLAGRTYGDHVMGLRVADGRGRRVRAPRALVRAIFCVGFPLGLFWCVNASRRSLQDVVLRTKVVYDWLPQHQTVPSDFTRSG